jgi:hypothetical protein
MGVETEWKRHAFHPWVHDFHGMFTVGMVFEYAVPDVECNTEAR